MGMRSQLIAHMHLGPYGWTGCHVHSTMHARMRSLAVEVYCAVYAHSSPWVVCVYSRTDCIVRSRPSRAVQSRAGSGS